MLLRKLLSICQDFFKLVFGIIGLLAASQAHALG